MRAPILGGCMTHIFVCVYLQIKSVISYMFKVPVSHIWIGCAAHAWMSCVTFTCEWLIQMCDRTHSYAWQDSFIRVTWLIHTCGMTHAYVRHDTFIYEAWPIHMSLNHITHLHESRHTNESRLRTYEPCLTYMSHATHTFKYRAGRTNESCHA